MYEEIRQLIRNARISQAIKMAIELATSLQAKEHGNELALLSSTHAKNERQNRNRLLSNADYDLQSSKTTMALLELLVEMERENSANTKPISNATKKALQHLDNANMTGYFEEMDKVAMSSDEKQTYARLKRIFISGQAPWDFFQQLSVFTKNIQLL